MVGLSGSTRQVGEADALEYDINMLLQILQSYHWQRMQLFQLEEIETRHRQRPNRPILLTPQLELPL